MLEQSIKTSLINKQIVSDEKFQHKVLLNKKYDKIFHHLQKYFQECEEFKIVVAFITCSGVSILKSILLELEAKGIKGQIITGDYQYFTDPLAIKQLAKYKNIEIRMLKQQNLHIKGYYFKKENNWNVIVGSSNLTSTALMTNQEMNIKLTSSIDGKVVEDILQNYKDLWNSANKYENFIKEYTKIYNFKKEKQKEYLVQLKELEQLYNNSNEIKPNDMQVQALEGLNNLRNKNENKALIIAATGTGKTYLAAFDIRNKKPKTILFIAHREKIVKDALNTFKSIIDNKTFGIYTGSQKEEADYIFATIQTLQNNLHKFNKEQFDYIIIDEVHHGGAHTYQNVINYFNTNFLLGLTATPERTDDFNIFEIFNYNIAYEIRLNKAYEYNLLTPFHYFGVTEIEVEGNLLQEKENINLLTSNQRVKHIIQKLDYYGHPRNKVQGLMFVSNTKEAKELSQKLNVLGYKTRALTSNDNESKRHETIQQLEQNNLDYIITVDIFNEGIDIPCVNQIVLLRPTQSAIIYIQQLGRGLRKYKNKEYTVVIDFIGNYKQNFLIPIALSGDNTYDKDRLKDDVLPNITNLIVGNSVINFEKIVQDRIIENISKVKFSNQKLIKQDFEYLQNKLSRIPTLLDFYNEKLINPITILEYKNTYIEIKKLILKTNKYDELLNNKYAYSYLEYISQKLTPAKRIEDIVILELLLNKQVNLTKKDIVNKLQSKYKIKEEIIDNALLHLTKEIFKSLSSHYKYKNLLTKENNKHKLSSEFVKVYKNNEVFKEEIDTLIELNKKIYNDKYKESNNKLIQVNEYYTKEEVFKYLLLDFNNGYQVGGYTVLKEVGKALLFITLSENNYSYKNVFKNGTINWYSTNNRVVKRNNILTSEGLIAKHKIDIEVFVKKQTNQKYTYLGKVKKVLDVKEENKQVECLFEI